MIKRNPNSVSEIRIGTSFSPFRSVDGIANIKWQCRAGGNGEKFAEAWLQIHSTHRGVTISKRINVDGPSVQTYITLFLESYLFSFTRFIVFPITYNSKTKPENEAHFIQLPLETGANLLKIENTYHFLVLNSEQL